MAKPLAAVVMAGGIGTRMKSATPKHLHPLLGRRMVDWVVEAARGAGVDRVVVVASPSTHELFDGVDVAVQEEPRGTGDAVRCAREALDDFEGGVLVLNGDVPALRPETIAALVETHRAAGAAATVLSFEPADAAAYGRIVRDASGGLARIVEARDASPEELALGEVNSGIYVFDAAKLRPALERLTRAADSVTGTARLRLHCDIDAHEQFARRLRGDDDDALDARPARGLDDPVDHSPAEQRMEVLRRRALHARADPSGHHYGCEWFRHVSQRLGRQDSNLGSRDQNPLPYRLATPQGAHHPTGAQVAADRARQGRKR